MKMNTIIHGDCLKELKKLKDNSVDLLCTDPPYGYSFMGKDWDKAVPSVEVWQECLRVLKPGAFAFIMSAPRSDVLSRMIVRIEDAGFRVDFTPIYWTYASGFPKAMNIGKMVDKRKGNKRTTLAKARQGKHDGGFKSDTAHKSGGPMPSEYNITRGTSPLEGSYGGFQPKPAVEVVIVAMKPLSEKTFVDQALKNGKGITWLDDCRVPTSETITNHARSAEAAISKGKYGNSKAQETHQTAGQALGRFPANLLVSDDMLGDHSRYFDLDTWAGKSTAPSVCRNCGYDFNHFLPNGLCEGCNRATRSTYPFLIVPKASKGEKNEGLEGLKGKPTYSEAHATPMRDHRQQVLKANHHPTVKPLKLMSYLITLGSREGDTVLEPFAGSGTTCLAAKNLGRNYIGVEREKEYVEIAKARLKNAPPIQPTLIAAE